MIEIQLKLPSLKQRTLLDHVSGEKTKQNRGRQVSGMAESSSSEDDDVIMNFSILCVCLSLFVSCFPFRAGFLHIMAKVTSSRSMFYSASLDTSGETKYLFLKSSM